MKKVRVPISKNLVGYELAEDIYEFENIILLKKGVILNEKYINKLIDKGFSYVYIKLKTI